MKHTPTHLSTCLIRAKNCYSDLEDMLADALENGITTDDQASMQDALDDLAFYMNEILEHSSPAHWTDEEYEWIEAVRADLTEAA